jgi:hypothetical protein
MILMRTPSEEISAAPSSRLPRSRLGDCLMGLVEQALGLGVG